MKQVRIINASSLEDAVSQLKALGDPISTKEKHNFIRAMSLEEFRATFTVEMKDFFDKHPELFASFKAQAEGDRSKSVELAKDVLTDSSIEDALSILSQLEAVASRSGVKELIQSVVEALEEGQSMTPEEQAEKELLKKHGVNVHFSYEQLATLHNIMEDSHTFVLEVLERADAQRGGKELTGRMANGYKEGISRHKAFHEFEEHLYEEIGKTYPHLGAADTEEQTGAEPEPTKH